MKRTVVALLAAGATLALALHHPGGWPLFAASLTPAAWAASARLRGSSRPLRFGLIVASGLFVEFFAWLHNFQAQTPNPPLFHPLLGPDLLIGLCFYASQAVGWLLVERLWGLRLRDVAALAAVYGVCIEQLGAVLRSFNPLAWLYVAAVYLAMSMPAFLLVPPTDRPGPVWRRYVLGLLLLAACSFALTALLSLPFARLLPPKPLTAGP